MNVNIPSGPTHMTEEQRKAIEKAWMGNMMYEHPWMPSTANPIFPSQSEIGVIQQQRELEMRRSANQANQAKRAKIAEFRESYIKIRTDNVVLTHETAIVLVKQIMSEADTLTYEDTL